MLAMGCGMLVSSLTTRYWDLRLVVSFGLQLWMFASPVIYPLSRAPERFRHYLALNPMAAILETFRSIFFGTPLPAAFYIFWSWVATLGLLFVGLVFFSKVEKNFTDTI
jgi:lipopolysaccharide transport system permease protein